MLCSGGGFSQAQAEQPIVDQSQPVGRLDTCLCPGSGVHAQPDPAAQAIEQAHEIFRVRTFESHIDSEFTRKLVEAGQGRRCAGRHDGFDIHGLGERKQPPAGAFVGRNRAGAIGHYSEAKLGQPVLYCRYFVRR